MWTAPRWTKKIGELETGLSGKAAASHTHPISEVTNLQSLLNGKAASAHTHAISEITNLQDTLNSKVNRSALPHITVDTSPEDNTQFGDKISTYLTVGSHRDRYIRGIPSFSAGTVNSTGYENAIALGFGNASNKNGISIGVGCHGGRFSGSSDKSIAIGFGAKALSGNISIGVMNRDMNENPLSSVTGDILCVGNGTGTINDIGMFSGAVSNAFRIQHDGSILAVKGYQSSGADYSERFEWTDGNPACEDRVGRFVALEGEQIRLCNPGDEILGIVSATPAIIGDSQSEEWIGRFQTDVFGRRLLGDDGCWILAPENNEHEPYIPRADRKEWECVGLLGKLIMIDDGTGQVNDYVKPTANGIATKSSEPTRCRVMKRIDSNHLKVMLL